MGITVVPRNHKRAALKYASLLVGLFAGQFALLLYLVPYLERLGAYSLAGVFGIAVVSNASLFVAIPGLSFPSVVAIANATHLLPVVAIYALGAVLGESLGYAAGAGGERFAALKENPRYLKAQGWLLNRRRRTRGLVLAFFAFFPFFPFDFVGIAAGTLRIPYWEFCVFTFLGRVPKYWLIFSVGTALWDPWFLAVRDLLL